MKSDVIIIANDGRGMDEALEQAEKVALYKGLAHKAALHLRLLTEEMMGMMRSITGEREGEFWIEEEGREFSLHLRVETLMDYDKQEQLLAASFSGKNEAAKGIMGKIRTFFDPMDWADAPTPTTLDPMNMMFSWSMIEYRQSVKEMMEQERAGAEEAWDELEKSVVSNLADDVKVSIKGRIAEMIILKKVKD
ncbi:MAG: hypothetical protein K5760_02305 [Clostridium sp.]|nr:hypothetical protein [Clostridium sp.]